MPRSAQGRGPDMSGHTGKPFTWMNATGYTAKRKQRAVTTSPQRCKVKLKGSAAVWLTASQVEQVCATLLHSHQVSLDEGDDDVHSSQRDLELLGPMGPLAADRLRRAALVQHVDLSDWSASVNVTGCDHL